MFQDGYCTANQKYLPLLTIEFTIINIINGSHGQVFAPAARTIHRWAQLWAPRKHREKNELTSKNKVIMKILTTKDGQNYVIVWRYDEI